MNAQCQKVLNRLRLRKARGVTWDQFARGFRLGARIFDLREAGYKIETINEQIGDCVRARYVLLAEPRRKRAA